MVFQYRSNSVIKFFYSVEQLGIHKVLYNFFIAFFSKNFFLTKFSFNLVINIVNGFLFIKLGQWGSSL